MPAQGIELSGSKLLLPDGNVLGVAFRPQEDTFFVQQLVLSTGEGGRGVLSSRLLSSWNWKTHTMLTKRVLDPSPLHLDSSPCARIEVSAKTNKILLCSPETHLEVTDPDSLNIVGKIAYRSDQYIYDFVVDDERGRIFVLSLRGDESPRLTSYSLLDGSQQQEALLTRTEGIRMSLALVPTTGQVAVAVDHRFRGDTKSDIYVCSSGETLYCRSVVQVEWASQISILGKELLIAPNIFPDRKTDCLVGVNLDTHAVARQYCSPSTGVHYAVGVANDSYVVAFTGVGKRLWLKEQNKVIENSFSVWRRGDTQIAAVAKDPTNYGGLQSVVRVFASRTQPWFIVYVGESNVLYLYSITESK
ncbi:MAG: hypothetical protein WBX38_14070 [Candidatus Sulfotelmatobacter sp.]